MHDIGPQAVEQRVERGPKASCAARAATSGQFMDGDRCVRSMSVGSDQDADFMAIALEQREVSSSILSHPPMGAIASDTWRIFIIPVCTRA
jgi:hypothetical protein